MSPRALKTVLVALQFFSEEMLQLYGTFGARERFKQEFGDIEPLDYQEVDELAEELREDQEKAQRDPWGEDPMYPREDWRQALAADETALGYWAWVDATRMMTGDDEDHEQRSKTGDGRTP